MVDIGSGAQREVEEYWLNKEQALLVSILSEAPNAPAVRRIYAAWSGSADHESSIVITNSSSDGPAERHTIEPSRKAGRERTWTFVHGPNRIHEAKL
jgi:hypothetical protein